MTALETKRWRFSKRTWLDGLAGYGFVSPALALIAVFTFFPIVYGFVLSFARWDMMSPQPRFIGMGNYVNLLKSPDFWHSLIVTGYYLAGTIPLTMGLGLALALALNRNFRGVALFRLIFYSTLVASTVAVAVIWLWMYDPINGIFNYFLIRLGFEPQKWLSSPASAMPSIILMDIWRYVGYDMILFLAGLQ